MTKSFFIALLLGFGTLTVSAQHYYFRAVEDHLFENPANWTPSFPGIHIAAGDSVFILDDAYITQYNLEVAGGLTIDWGVQLHVKGNISILPQGSLVNMGYIGVNALFNRGQLSNRYAGAMDMDTFYTYPHSQSFNAASASIKALYRLVNAGRFDNYGRCEVGEFFENQAVFNQMQSSKLLIRGKFLLADGSKLYQSDNSHLLYPQKHYR